MVRGQGGRFEFVDGLRGLAALAVVLPHAVGLFIYPHESWVSAQFSRLAGYGAGGVEVFFVVSGFAIAYSLRDTRTEGFSLARFMLRRAVRLDPPYWVGLLWLALVEVIHALFTHQPVVLPSFGKVLAHVFYLQDILGLGQFNLVFWTLCLEFQLYLVFAVMMRMASALGDVPYKSEAGILREADNHGWLMAIAFLVSLVLSHTVWPMHHDWFVPFFYLFLSGSLAAWRTLGRISDRLYRVCLLVMGLALFVRADSFRVIGFLTALVLYAAIPRGALHRWLAARSAQWLGRISYSTYLVHVPLVAFFLALRTRLGSDSKLMSLVCLTGLYVVTLALASLFHVTVEVPCLRLSQQLKRQRSIEAARVPQAPPA